MVTEFGRYSGSVPLEFKTDRSEQAKTLGYLLWSEQLVKKEYTATNKYEWSYLCYNQIAVPFRLNLRIWLNSHIRLSSVLGSKGRTNKCKNAQRIHSVAFKLKYFEGYMLFRIFNANTLKRIHESESKFFVMLPKEVVAMPALTSIKFNYFRPIYYRAVIH